MTSWLLLSLALITFVNRYAFFAQTLRYTPSPAVKRFMSYSSYAVLTAIWMPIVFQMQTNGKLSIAGLDYAIAALIAALLTIAQVRSLFVVLLSTGSFFCLRFILL